MSPAVALSPRAAAVATLAIHRLVLRDFRGYASATLATEGHPVVLAGPNGAGKTNLLEAVSLLAPGRGLRHARLADLDRRGGGPWALAARIVGRDGPADVISAHERETERRSVALDGRPQRSAAALAEQLSIVWLTPAMDRLFVEGSSERRRFLDRLVFAVDPGHARRVSLYERTLRERSLLLRTGRGDPAWLGALERRAAECGVAISAARRQLLAGLDEALAATRLPFPRPRLQLVDELALQLDHLPAVEVEALFAAALAAARQQDAQGGGAARGPHRADLEAFDRASDEPARLASTGRQKAYLLSVVLAHAELRHGLYGDRPVLLLDEVAAHLDARHRADLFAILADQGGQFWLSGTDPEIFRGLAGVARRFLVRDATLTPDD